MKIIKAEQVISCFRFMVCMKLKITFTNIFHKNLCKFCLIIDKRILGDFSIWKFPVHKM